LHWRQQAWRVGGWLGIIPLFTGMVRFCPVYRIAGINNDSKNNQIALQICAHHSGLNKEQGSER
jgi:hypothetical protein